MKYTLGITHQLHLWLITAHIYTVHNQLSGISVVSAFLCTWHVSACGVGLAGRQDCTTAQTSLVSAYNVEYQQASFPNIHDFQLLIVVVDFKVMKYYVKLFWISFVLIVIPSVLRVSKCQNSTIIAVSNNCCDNGDIFKNFSIILSPNQINFYFIDLPWFIGLFSPSNSNQLKNNISFWLRLLYFYVCVIQNYSFNIDDKYH